MNSFDYIKPSAQVVPQGSDQGFCNKLIKQHKGARNKAQEMYGFSKNHCHKKVFGCIRDHIGGTRKKLETRPKPH